MKNPTGRTGFWCLLFLGGIGLFLPTLGAAAGVEVWNPLTRTPQGIVVSLDRLQGQPPLRILPDRLVVRSLETEEGPAIREAVSAELHRRAPGTIFARVDYVPCQVIAVFSQADLVAGRVVFVHDAANVAPVVVLHETRDRSLGTAPASARRASWARPAARSRARALPRRRRDRGAAPPAAPR